MIIKSLLDTDWYKITMAQVVYYHFSDWKVKYKFINRGKDKFPEGFDKLLIQELNDLSKIKLTDNEKEWLLKQNSIYPEFVEWFSNYKFEPQKEVFISLREGNLNIEIIGNWLRTIFWEVPLLAIISELYYKSQGKKLNLNNFIKNTKKKSKLLCFPFIDFGTRRRFSFESQSTINRIFKNTNKNFLGTSNPYFAMFYEKTPIGTFAHEAIMAMQVHSIYHSNHNWYIIWRNLYGKQNSVALGDTLTTDYFFKTMPLHELKLMDGIRQDSGDPIKIGKKIIKKWKELKINPKHKKIIFSDNLNPELAKKIYEIFKNITNPIFGIGTNLTNDCGYKPLNMVIKLDEVKGQKVVKLSDDKNKYTGDSSQLRLICETVEKEITNE